MPSDKKLSAREAYQQGTCYQFDTESLPLGPWTSYSMINDPKHMSFVLARYKFCAKMLEGRGKVAEVGSGDGFGLPIVASAVGEVCCLDWDQRLLDGMKGRLPFLKNVSYHCVDLNEKPADMKVEAVYMIDVIEHIDPEAEENFMRHVVECIEPDGVIILGTPSIHAEQYQSERSRVQHINLKSQKTLRELTARYFKNVFMFGMNDEVLHTGYAPMCHYIWAVGAGRRV
ncbi:class I SAM-dependent methyltransferase [Humidesulfovibrio idahonensis]